MLTDSRWPFSPATTWQLLAVLALLPLLALQLAAGGAVSGGVLLVLNLALLAGQLHRLLGAHA